MWNRFTAWFNKYPLRWMNSAWEQITWTTLPADTDLGRRSRLLAAAQMIILVLGCVAQIQYMVWNWEGLDLSVGLPFAAFIILVLAYLLNRRGYFKAATGITIGTITFAVYSLLWLLREAEHPADVLIYLMLPILLSNFILPWLWYTATVTLILAGITPFLSLPGVTDIFIYLFLSASLLGIFSHYQQSLEHVRLTDLRESEKRYHHILDSMMEGCQIIDFDWRYVYVNDVVAGQGRRRADELLGHTMMEIYPGIETTELFTVLHRCMETRAPARMENQFSFPDGSVGWFELSIQPAREGIFILSSDITERKQADEALRASEERFRDLIKNGRDNISLLSPDGTLLWESPAEFNTLGYEPNQFVKRNIFELMHPDDLAWTQSMFEQIVRVPGQSIEGVFRLLHRDGSWRWIEATATNLLEAASIQAIVVNYRDITERKKADEALRTSEEKLQLFIQYAPAALAMYDHEMRFLAVSQRWITDYRLEGAEILGRSHYEIFPEVSEQRRELHRRGLNGEVVRANEDRFVRANGEVQWLKSEMHPWHAQDGSVGGIVIFSEDITERRQAREALRAAEEKYRNIFENAMEGIHQSTRDGKVISVNPAAARILGFNSPEELISSASDLNNHFYVEPGRRAEFIKLMEEHEAVSGFESEVYRKDGSKVWISENVHTVRDKNGALLYYEGTSEDITKRKQAEEDERRHLRELEALNVVSSSLRAAQTTEEALPILLDQTLIALGCEDGEISLFDPVDEKLHVAQARGWFATLGQDPVNVGEGIIGTVFASGEPLQIHEIASDSRLHPIFASQVPAGWSGACVPIRSESETVGVLSISVRLPNRISPESMKLLQSLAEMAGAMLHRMRLHEQTTSRLAHLQALRTVDQAITSSFDQRFTLNILLEQSVFHLNADAAGILLLEPQSHLLEYATGHGFRSRDYARSKVRLGEGIAGRAALDRQVIQVYNLKDADKNFVRASLLADEDFETCFAAPLIAKGQVLGVLEVYHRKPYRPNEEWLDFLETLAGQAAIAIDNARLFENMQRSNTDLSLAYDATIEGWSRAMDLRDKETEGHTQRVTELTMELARAMDTDSYELIHIRRGALLHDIGKMGVPDGILLKPGKLTDDEWVIMRRHPEFAHEMIHPIEFLRPALDIPHCHHEKWDGSGYPRGLKGEEIPLAARIFAVVDVWDAITSDRPYRKAWSKEKALEYIREQSGTHFDPRVVELFLGLMAR